METIFSFQNINFDYEKLFAIQNKLKSRNSTNRENALKHKHSVSINSQSKQTNIIREFEKETVLRRN